eukprot:CAMPEP_0175179574 /NCGR_PEP_ID=MMETSP0087-20121206/35592_1 /TAXON_ID=136419 /ORGANISM="Unknown Unknown, Strain D1" /LENGTH=301 /DNA_ID=CAMNT_0016471827 /DNA_START=90 /DNA_END=992 /DNA_ORIENTATION=+
MDFSGRSELQETSSRVFITNFFGAKNYDLLSESNITHVLVAAAELPFALEEKGLIYGRVAVADNTHVQLPLDEACTFIQQSLASSPQTNPGFLEQLADFEKALQGKAVQADQTDENKVAGASGETDLTALLKNIQPELHVAAAEGREGQPCEYVFCTVKGGKYGDYAEAQPICSYLEAEGLTLIAPKHKADQCGLEYDGVFCCITLKIHSSLEAVGLTAAVSHKLAQNGVSANVVAAFYHDHVFVGRKDAEKAVPWPCWKSSKLAESREKIWLLHVEQSSRDDNLNSLVAVSIARTTKLRV